LTLARRLLPTTRLNVKLDPVEFARKASDGRGDIEGLWSNRGEPQFEEETFTCRGSGMLVLMARTSEMDRLTMMATS
jgi:hypothetical protein